MTAASAHFRAMNTDITLLDPEGGPAFERAAAVARGIFEEIEACLSRFRPDSELSALNRSAGRPFAASPLLFSTGFLALDAARATQSDGA
jgi:thiamine biosynthesis lipoprotein